jgi:K+-sensing histidine kinase KdpD
MKNQSEPSSLTRIVHSLEAVGAVFALTVVMLLIGQKTLGEGVIVLLYLVPIGWCTVRWGQIAGVSAALTSALCFDFLFIPPYGTFSIGSMEGWLLLFLFIAVAILVVGRILSTLSEEQNRERKATFLYEMVVAIANQQTSEGIAGAIANQTQEKYLAELIQVQLIGRGKLSLVGMSASNQPDTTARRKPDRALPIISGPALIGKIAIWEGLLPLPPEDDPMLQTLLRQIVAALYRAQIVEENAAPTARPHVGTITI